MKKFVSLLLVSSMLVTLASGCTSGSSTPSTPAENSAGESGSGAEPVKENFQKEGFPIVNEKITLEFVTMQTTVQADYNEMKMWETYEEMTNIHINWTGIPTEFLAEKRNIIMASNDLPDAFFKMAFPSTDITSYANQGLFIGLDELIQEHAPNIQKAFADYPDVDSGITMSDGKKYSLPYIVSAFSPRMGSKMFFNQDVLAQNKQAIPATTDELYEVLKAIQGTDLNKNGQADEVPLSAEGINSILYGLRGAWGLGTRGASAGNIDIDPETGALRYIPASSAYRELLEYVKVLFDEKLLDQEIFTMDLPKLRAKGEAGRVLSHFAINHTYMGLQYQDAQVGLEAALTGPYGDQLVSQSSALSSIGAFVITNTNPYPRETMRWVDYFYGDDGMVLMFMGEEGVTYEKKEDGLFEFLPFITNNPNGLSYEQAQGEYICWAGGANPSIAGEKYFKGPAMLPISTAAAQNLAPYAPEKIWPPFVFAQEDNDTILTLNGDLKTFTDEMCAQFITGKRSFDEWESYVAELNNIGLPEYLSIYEKAAAFYE